MTAETAAGSDQSSVAAVVVARLAGSVVDFVAAVEMSDVRPFVDARTASRRQHEPPPSSGWLRCTRHVSSVH